MRLVTLLKKEARVLLRSRLLLMVLILYPLVLVGILGYAFSQPQRIPIAIVNEDLDETGRPDTGVVPPVSPGDEPYIVSSTDIIKRIKSLEDDGFIRVLETNFADGRAKLLDGEVQAIVQFPAGFADKLAGYQQAAAAVVTIDKSDPVRSSFMNLTIQGVVRDFQEEVVNKKADRILNYLRLTLNIEPDCRSEGADVCPGFPGVVSRLRQVEQNATLSTENRQRILDSIAFMEEKVIPNLQVADQVVRSMALPLQVNIKGESSGTDQIRDLVIPAALGLSIFWTGSIATSSLVVYERESPAYTRLRITPASALSIYGSKILLTVLIILGQTLVILVAVTSAFEATVDNLPLTMLILLLSTLASVGLGLLLAGLTRDVSSVVLLSVLITFPMLFLSGLFYPVDFMPEAAQVLAALFPLTYTVTGLRGSMLRGFDFADGQETVVALALFAVILSAVGFFLSRRLELRR